MCTLRGAAPGWIRTARYQAHRLLCMACGVAESGRQSGAAAAQPGAHAGCALKYALFTVAEPHLGGTTVAVYSCNGFGGAFVGTLVFSLPLDWLDETARPSAWVMAFGICAIACLVGGIEPPSCCAIRGMRGLGGGVPGSKSDNVARSLSLNGCGVSPSAPSRTLERDVRAE